jgi:sigma-54 dependent transcriptional regulator, acetoin dehydrogenase operon transcriptional activator AcoR
MDGLLKIPDKFTAICQDMVDVLADVFRVPAALIRRLRLFDLEVFSANHSAPHPYTIGKRSPLRAYYCHRVVETGKRLLVANAQQDGGWTGNTDVQAGMIAYLGLPLFWPDKEVFGTICVLDSKENQFDNPLERLLESFRAAVEAQLTIIYKEFAEERRLETILDSLTEGIIVHDTERRIQFFNKAAEAITGYAKQEVVGKDCHEAFGQPFCGGRCAFEHGCPDCFDSLYYPLNILTKNGEPRRIEMALTGRQDPDGNLLGVIASFRDVTDITGLKIQVGDLDSFAGIVGRDAKMLQVYRQIQELGTNDYPVHIFGETGTGKELVATAIHNDSRRGGGPFVPVNCAALPEGVLESELFGHVKGAFTGALRDKKGRFELAHKGSLFLDEVADLPKVVQAKLLRVLQEGTFERVGDDKVTSVDVRIISASNRNLKQEVEKGRFRDDLYYRINVVPIEMPPMRKRKKDIPLLLDHFLKQARQEGQRSTGVSKEALALIIRYPWPGNVRELQSAVRFALVKTRGRVIRPEDLPMELKQWGQERPTPGPTRKLATEGVQNALAQTGGNKAKAARLLGVGRATLYRFLADR